MTTKNTVGHVVSQTDSEMVIAYPFSGRGYAILDAIRLARHHCTLVSILGFGHTIVVSAVSSFTLTYRESIYPRPRGGE